MLSKTNIVKLVMGVILLAIWAMPQKSFADWSIGIGVGDGGHHHDDFHHGDHDFYRWHDHPHYGYHMHFLPPGAVTIWVGGIRYYYYDGLFYSYVGDGDFIIVNPPIGAYVDVIPQDFQPVNINGRIYYTDNGVYYLLTHHHGYKVVEAPVIGYVGPTQVVVAQPQQVVVSQPVQQVVVAQPAPAPTPVYAQDSFPVNIPNNSGGFSTVVIKKSGNGYVGPQGEFYASFPTVAQLKAMYVK